VLCVKPDECALWQRYAQQTGRSESLLIVSPKHKWRFGFLNYLLRVGASTEQIVGCFTTVLELADHGEKGQGKNDKLWERAVRQLIRNAIDICVLAKGTLSVSLLNKIISSAPRTHAEIHEEAWQAESFCYQCIVEADAKEKTPSQQNDFDLSASYFLREFVDFPPETRRSILATWSVFGDSFLRGVVNELFGGETNFVPELSHTGAVIVIDLPVKQYGQAGVFVQAMFKYIWQFAAERRDVGKNPRFSFFFCDEFQELVTERDAEFFATARSSRICSIVLTQTISGYYAVLGGESGRYKTEAMLGALTTQIFHATSGETARYASALFAKSFQTRMNFSSSRGHHDNSSGGGSEALESKVLEAELTQVAKGGPENNWCTEAIVFQGGKTWKATGDTMLWVTFRQRH
jgi:hypothetical protein